MPQGVLIFIPPGSGSKRATRRGFSFGGVRVTKPERSIVFIDGNNWFHGLVAAGVTQRSQLNYAKISTKIIGAREWIATRYYIGQVRQEENHQLYADQRRFLAMLSATDKRITTYLGRLEPRFIENDLAKEIKRYLAELPMKIDKDVYKQLVTLADHHRTTRIMAEKAVDVMIAVDMVKMAEHSDYDTAYLLSADGDYTPVAEYVASLGKKVFAASPLHGAELAKVVYKFIPLDELWFKDCY